MRPARRKQVIFNHSNVSKIDTTQRKGPMRLLLFSSEFPPGPGGIGTQAFELARNLQQLGWEVAVIAPQDYSSEEEVRAFNERQPFPVLRWRSLRWPILTAIYRPLMAAFQVLYRRPDVILATGDRIVYFAAVVCSLFRIPWVAVVHGRMPAWWERALRRWAFERADKVVSVSQYTLEEMRQSGIRPRAVIIPNGADPTMFIVLPQSEISRARTSLGLPDERLILTVGKISPRKGQDVIIRALPLILEKAPDVHYIMIGLPQSKDEFAALAVELGVADRVHFLGRVDSDEVVRQMNACDLFAMTSTYRDNEYEGYGIAVIEAALCGKTAVVSGGSGLQEAVVEGVTGLVVPVEDSAATAEAIVTLLKDEPLRREMEAEARRRALAEGTWRHRAEQYVAVLRSVLRPQPAGTTGEQS